MHYISYETGKKYYVEQGNSFLNNCPVCNVPLLWNCYEKMYVSDKQEVYQDNINMKIEKCRKCGDIFILLY